MLLRLRHAQGLPRNPEPLRHTRTQGVSRRMTRASTTALPVAIFYSIEFRNVQRMVIERHGSREAVTKIVNTGESDRKTFQPCRMR
jgi:hypothetical protein